MVVHELVSSMTAAVQAQANSIDALAGDQTHITHSMLALESQTEDISASTNNQNASLTFGLRALEGRALRLVPLLTQLKCRGLPSATTTLIEPNQVPLAAKIANRE